MTTIERKKNTDINQNHLTDKNAATAFLINVHELTMVSSLEGTLVSFLNLSEKERYQRFKNNADKTFYLYTHGILQTIFAFITNKRPGSIEYSFNAQGKPFFSLYDHIKFNISHSNEYALFAFSGSPVGADIEFMRNMPQIDSLLYRYSKNNLSLQTLSEKEKMDIFFRYWTHREAFAKYHGISVFEVLSTIDKNLNWSFNFLNNGGDTKNKNVNIYECNEQEGYKIAIASPVRKKSHISLHRITPQILTSWIHAVKLTTGSK